MPVNLSTLLSYSLSVRPLGFDIEVLTKMLFFSQQRKRNWLFFVPGVVCGLRNTDRLLLLLLPLLLLQLLLRKVQTTSTCRHWRLSQFTCKFLHCLFAWDILHDSWHVSFIISVFFTAACSSFISNNPYVGACFLEIKVRVNEVFHLQFLAEVEVGGGFFR